LEYLGEKLHCAVVSVVTGQDVLFIAWSSNKVINRINDSTLKVPLWTCAESGKLSLSYFKMN